MGSPHLLELPLYLINLITDKLLEVYSEDCPSDDRDFSASTVDIEEFSTKPDPTSLEPQPPFLLISS